MQGYIRHAVMVGAFLVSGLFLTGGSCDDEKIPSCDEAMDTFYDANCVMVVNGEYVTESQAEDGCEDEPGKLAPIHGFLLSCESAREKS